MSAGTFKLELKLSKRPAIEGHTEGAGSTADANLPGSRHPHGLAASQNEQR